MGRIVLVILLVIMLIFLGNFVMDIIRRRKTDERKYNKKEMFLAFGLLAPSAILAFLFVLLPIFFSLGFGFTDFVLSEPDINFVGFDQFSRLIDEFKHHYPIYYAFRNTALFVVLVVPLQIGLALLLALFCNNKRRGTTIFKICFFAPVAVSLTITCYLWQVILSGSDSSVINNILHFFGIESQDFLRQPNSIIIWMVVISAWQGCGFQMLIFLSALGNIRKDLYEAAAIDGANAFRRFKTVTLPGLKPTFLFILITVFVGACRVIIQPRLLSPDAGRGDNSITLSLFMVDKATATDGGIGYSCAIAFVLTILLGTITLIQRRLLGEKKR